MTFKESIGAMLRLASGSGSAQVIQFGSALVLARLLEPAVFGDYTVFFGYGSMLIAIGSLKLEQAIQLQATDAQAREFGRSALLVGGPLTFLLACLLGTAGWLGWLPGSQSWRPDWFAALPAFAWLGIAFNTATAWHIRRARFALVARMRWLMAGGVAAGQIAGALCGLGLTGQIWGSVLGTFVGLTTAHFGLLRARWSRGLAGTAFDEHAAGAAACWTGWREHSVNLVLAALVGTAAWQIPPVLLREFWGADAAGCYALAFRISSAPLAILQAAFSDIAYRETTIRLQAGAGLREYVRRSILALFVLSAAIAVAATLATPWGVPAVLGARWHWVASLLPWMMFSFVFRLTGGTLSLFTQTGRTGLFLAWQVAFLLAHLACFAGAHYAGLGLMGVTIAAALVQSGFYLLLVLANFSLAARPTRP
jgi:O-antigen/teichoic acid export membrane protein